MLTRLQKELVKELKVEGFYDLDDHEYRPHLTLGRRVTTVREFDEKSFAAEIPVLQTDVTRLSLMKSERIGGKLTYTEIYSIELD
jgi:2'-5' RNA ligase